MTEKEALEIVRKNEPIITACTYMILFINDFACGAVIDAVCLLEKSNMYRHRVKQLTRKVHSERKSYERRVNGIIAEKSQFYADANDVFTDDVQRHADIFYYTIKQHLDKHRIRDSDIIARTEYARAITGIACVVYSWCMDELKRADKQIPMVFSLEYIHLSALHKLLKNLVDILPCKEYVNLNTPEIQSAADILIHKFTNEDTIRKAISS